MNIRSSDVFLKSDLAAILRGMAMTVQAVGKHDDFDLGYLTAVAAFATALNISPADVIEVSRGKHNE
jgi:hypothetical protein